MEGIKAWLRLQREPFTYMRMVAEVLLLPDDNSNRTRGGWEYTGIRYAGYVWKQFLAARYELLDEGIHFDEVEEDHVKTFHPVRRDDA